MIIFNKKDTASDFSRPERSIVFNQRYFGGNGNRINNYCIRNGFLRGRIVDYPSPHCLRRRFSGAFNRIRSWQSPAFITSIIQSNNAFDSFRENLEFSHHATVHWSIGGDIGDVNAAHSPME